jgi:chromosome segregation ATPase
MMQPHQTFLPDTLDGWIGVVAWAVATIAAGAIAWHRVTVKVNGLGGRVDSIEQRKSELAGRMQSVERWQEHAANERSDMQSRLGRVEKGVEGCSEKITDAMMTLGSAIADLKNTVLREDSKVSQRVTRVETLVAIERKLGHQISDVTRDTMMTHEDTRMTKHIGRLVSGTSLAVLGLVIVLDRARALLDRPSIRSIRGPS